MACIQKCNGNGVVVKGAGKHHVRGGSCLVTRVLVSVDCGIDQATLSTKWVLIDSDDLSESQGEKERRGVEGKRGRRREKEGGREGGGEINVSVVMICLTGFAARLWTRPVSSLSHLTSARAVRKKNTDSKDYL